MIDTNELRRLAQAALAGPDGISLNWVKLLQDFQQKASPAAISELLDRLKAAEKERDELLDALKSIEEYWNQDQNETAMVDACWHAINTARAAIARATGDQP